MTSNSRHILMKIYNLKLSKKLFYAFILSAIASIIVGLAGYKKYMVLCLITFIFFSIIIITFHIYSKISKRIIKWADTDPSKIDLKKNESYYRDLIEHYNLAELSYIDDLEVDEKDVVVLLLNMELNGIIKLDDGNIRIIDTTKINRISEEYIINCIENNKLGKVNIIDFKNKILEDCLNEGLIEKRSPFIVVFLLLLLYPFILIINVFGISKWLFLIAFIMAFMANQYKRTNEGKKINRKLEGLKLFLKDFTTLDKKEHKELLLWGDYLIYSVLFNQNKKIKDEMIRKYLK